ncbi:CheR family methyltransferase [Caballeronia sp. LZ033]|uniref:CheR family methyltransferase n=1 Tax=Caballeronia sp. LZ033 TaxID=3038566 RepID=UPI002864C29F|nr:CheR family methyltransferase [Caballeronia sp. LZ033]MDR5817284.1 CheR family methyltransferase [Caballeronia sp. LZ033]
MAESLNADERQTHVRIVAVGASAGGITALQRLFEGLPGNLPYALVVLQHLPAGLPSGLPGLIARWTRMPVQRAIGGARPKAGTIYIPSPDDILTLEHDVFETRPLEGGGRRPGIDTIDCFLESLALRTEPPPVAVILSGTGMDGTAGATLVRQAGGIVIVQDPLTALHDAMPNSVIQRHVHDHVLHAGAIGRQLMACADPAYERPVPPADWSSITSQTLAHIVGLVRQRAGFNLGGYKPSPLLWRIQQRMDMRKVWSLEDYASLLRDDPVELEALARGISIHVTGFFRDPDAWAVLQADVLQRLIAEAGKERILRVWTPACATGEEAFSIAMLLDELARDAAEPFDFQIFATDAAPEVVASASLGQFNARSLTGLSPARQGRYFYKVDATFRVKRFLREKLVFAPQDLISDPPLSGLDLVTCRNLFIYLERETVCDVLFSLHGSLRMGGYLLLGRSEAYPLDKQGFEVVSRKWNIYRKVGPMHEVPRSVVRRVASDEERLAKLALRLAYEQFDVPSVLIDEDGSILRVYGDTKDVLRLAAGEPSLRITDLVPKQWEARLRHSIRQILADQQPITLEGLKLDGAENMPMRVRLTPLQASAGAACDRVLVSFVREQDAADASEAEGTPLMRGDLDVAESVDWKDKARVSRDELEASREELQALNEELKASNEQLNRSNGDLNVANVALQKNIEQLAMQSRVLSSGAVMTMFLDPDLRLRWFTPSMRDVFPLMPGDTGRNITDLVTKFPDAAFYTDIHAVLCASEPREAIIRDSHDHTFVRKIYPYVSETNAITGVAITFMDISDHARAEAVIARSRAWLSAQKDAFQAAMNGASLDTSLGILVRTLSNQSPERGRCAFFVAEGSVLRHVVGMSDEYARCVDGFEISPESLACGLAVATGKPVITADVFDEPSWQSWIWLAEKFGYRGCWSFPVQTPEGGLIGALAMYSREPRLPTSMDLELAEVFTQTAGVIMGRFLGEGRAL